MVDYIVTDTNGDFLMEGDPIHSVEGTRGVFGGVVGHDPEGGGMLILANGQAQYASYWNLYVEEIADEFDEYEIYFGGYADDEDDFSGYNVEDEYYADLYGEPYEDDDRY